MASESIEDLAQKWLLWDRDPTTAAEITSLSEAVYQPAPLSIEARTELENRLRNRIQFGTAGLRARMQAGFAFLNCLTVIQASQGIAQYLLSASTIQTPPSVVIGHDTRHNSARFARLASNAFREKGFRVHLLRDYVPTPLVAFAVKTMQATAGIMITASHNPAQDNGYKVYQSNGAQINTPVDQYMAESIQQNLEPWDKAWDEGKVQPESQDILSTLRDQYVQQLLSLHNLTRGHRATTSRHIAGVYTSMHGVGWTLAAEVAMRVNNCTLIPVAEQVHPNPDFPTVKFPNPEEDGALQLAFNTADSVGETIVMANDPDADRFAVAQKIDSGWRRFTGDQLGVLLADYLLENELQTSKRRDVVMLCSAVSSGMLKKMLKAAGPRFHFEGTLTGFKWIGNRADQLQHGGLHPLFGYEEALGYMFPGISWDKDGIAALSVFLCALSVWRQQGLDPWGRLEQLYQRYGHHESINTYFVSPSPSHTKQFFAGIRGSEALSRMSLGSYRIIKWRDPTNGVESGTWEENLPLDKTSEMLQFQLGEDETTATTKPAPMKAPDAWPTEVSFTIRASGTEPKVKVYLEASGRIEDDVFHHAAHVFSALLREWISPFGKELRHSGTAVSSSGRLISITV